MPIRSVNGVVELHVHAELGQQRRRYREHGQSQESGRAIEQPSSDEVACPQNREPNAVREEVEGERGCPGQGKPGGQGIRGTGPHVLDAQMVDGEGPSQDLDSRNREATSVSRHPLIEAVREAEGTDHCPQHEKPCGETASGTPGQRQAHRETAAQGRSSGHGSKCSPGGRR